MSTGIDIKKKLAILEEGVNITTDAKSIDFVGSGVNSSSVGGNVTVNIPGGSGTTTYYLNESVTQTPYKEFSSIATIAAEQVVPLTVSAGVTSVIAEYLTPTGVPGTTQIPTGLWQFFLHFNAGATGQNWIIRPEVYKRDLGGIETLLLTLDPVVVTNMSTTTTMYVSDAVFPFTTILTTDRILVRISIQNTTGVSQTVNFRTEGSQHYSVGLTTLNQVVPTGAVTSVTGTAPIVSSGGLTPAISIPLATGSANGYLSSSDWSTFSAKLGGSGTINRLSKWTSSTALGNSLFEDDGTSIAIGTNPSASIKLDVYSTLVQSIRGVNGSTSVGNKTAIEGTANGANGTNIGGYFYAQNGTNNYSIWLQDGTQAAGKVLTSMTADGKAQWATPSGVSGSGTTNYLSKFTPNGTTLGNSLLQDNGTSMSVNTTPSSTYGFYFNYSSGAASIYGANSYSAAGQESVGVAGTGSGTGGSNNIGGAFNAFNNATLNIGVRAVANAPTAGTNVGGVFQALNGTINYAAQLQDGTQGIGKVLTCITSDGKANWVTPSSAGSGVCGIANSSGVYTYYATLSLAITAATSGQTVDLLTDITETGSVTLSMKAGVKINGNGYTYTLSVNDDSNAMVNGSSLLIELFNLKVVRTGRSANAGGRVFGKNDTGSLLHLKCQNVVFENTYGVGVGANVAIIYGLTVNAYGEGVTAPYDSTGLNNCIITSSTSYGVYLPNSGSNIVNCDVTGSIFGMHAGFGTVYNSIGKTTSGTGIQATRVVNSTGTSSSGTGVVATNGYNCVGISTSGVGLSGTFTNSTGISTSGFASSGGTKTNCTLISSSNYGSNLENLNNCFLQSTTNVPLWLNSSKLINGCTVLCLWDNVGGHAINTSAASTGIEIRNCNLTVTNASAYCLNSPLGSTFKYASNTYKGVTAAVNTTNITQGITNTSDNQGNILI